MDPTQIAKRMLGGATPSVLMSDAYKFSMVEAGFPLREETFYLSFRRPGGYRVPFDLAAVVRALRPEALERDLAFLEAAGYGIGPAARAALREPLDIWAAPAGAWLREHEPIVRVTAPSFLASWLEPLVIWLHYPIQVATEASRGRRSFLCTSSDEAELTTLALRAVGLADASQVTIDAAGYEARVADHASCLRDALEDRRDAALLEVGMRSASCMATHELALRGCMRAGIARTSNVFLARELGATPAGTAGHEHTLRWGSDLAAFRALRDRRDGPPSYLVDTYDARTRGIPAAITALRESPGRAASVRFDSGDAAAQLDAFVAAGVAPTFVFMDGLDADRVRTIEAVARARGIAPARRVYGAGGFLVGRPSGSSLTRDRVSAVYKLSQSGPEPVMKLGAPGKTSMPGRPSVFRRTSGSGPIGLIAQVGEEPPPGYAVLDATAEAERDPEGTGTVEPSSATHALIARVRRETLGARGEEA